ncbi:hypothetical protein B0H19DRAFT_493568 [Mycena capillaripes]|nr:hypothetical protein B0H19DRAFT_493568 [Mycena capillaripes]
MATPEQVEQQLFALLADARTTNELAVAGVTLLVMEHILTFPDEVTLMWKSRFSVSNAFYIWIRYFTLIALSIDLSFMLKVEWSDHLPDFLFQTIACTIIVVSADVILVLRVWILYAKSRKLLYFLVPLIAAEIIAMIIVGIFTIKGLERYVHVGPVLQGCYSLEVPRLFTFYAVPSLVTAVSMFSLTAYKCGTTLKNLGLKGTPIISLFLRDGVFWFLGNLLVSVVEIVLWKRARPTLAQIPVVPATAIIAVIGARVVLNIKNIASHNDINATTTVETELMVRPSRSGSGRGLANYGGDTSKFGGQDAYFERI